MTRTPGCSQQNALLNRALNYSPCPWLWKSSEKKKSHKETSCPHSSAWTTWQKTIQKSSWPVTERTSIQVSSKQLWISDCVKWGSVQRARICSSCGSTFARSEWDWHGPVWDLAGSWQWYAVKTCTCTVHCVHANRRTIPGSVVMRLQNREARFPLSRRTFFEEGGWEMRAASNIVKT